MKPIIIAIEEKPELLQRINNNITILPLDNQSRLFYTSSSYNLSHYWNTGENPAHVAYNPVNINGVVNGLPFSKHKRKYI
jgi:hypothetical protein